MGSSGCGYKMGMTHPATWVAVRLRQTACRTEPGCSRCSGNTTCRTPNLHGQSPAHLPTWRSHRLLRLDTSSSPPTSCFPDRRHHLPSSSGNQGQILVPFLSLAPGSWEFHPHKSLNISNLSPRSRSPPPPRRLRPQGGP